MANRIAGITVEISGDTTKLSTALRSTGILKTGSDDKPARNGCGYR